MSLETELEPEFAKLFKRAGFAISLRLLVKWFKTGWDHRSAEWPWWVKSVYGMLESAEQLYAHRDEIFTED